MPRLRQVSRAEVTDPVIQYLYQRKYGDRDPVAEPGTAMGSPGDWETVFALVPDVFEHAMQGFAMWQRPERRIDPVLRELGIARVGWLCGSQFVYSQHLKVLRAAGASQAMAEAVTGWQLSDQFSPVQRAALAYADALATQHGRTPDLVFDELKRHLSDEEIVEFTYIVTMYVMHAIMTRALRLEFDDRADPVVEVPAPEGFSFATAHTPMVLPSRAKPGA